MTHGRRSPHTKCANISLPYDLTETFKERVLSLRPSVPTDYLKEQIFSKFVSSDTDPAELRRARAIEKWLATESLNEATNERLTNTHEEYNILPRVSFARFVETCRDIIVGVIGEVPAESAFIGAFSGGASTSRKRTESQPAQKYLGQADVTPLCQALFDIWKVEMPAWWGSGHEIRENQVVGNVLFTVPKKTDIDRCACKEPDLNMFIQKGAGKHIRACLRRIGIDLNDQARNRSLAREGSISGKLATLDLSSASDSVSYELVKLLLPDLWFFLLDTVRCHVTIIDGVEHRNQMFSSMGNGFTFELESLLFYTLVRATMYHTGTPGVVSVYGDDIICPVESVHYTQYVLNYFGFTVNRDKSFVEGPFRESCGGHFYDGRDITPFYVKGPVNTLVDAMHVANQLRAWAERIAFTSILDPEVEEIWLWLTSFIPKQLWGGVDTSFKYQLASEGMPQCRLSAEKRTVDSGIGGYLHWLNATWDRTQSPGVYGWKTVEAVTTSVLSLEKKTFRLRKVRVKTVTRFAKVWLHEANSR